MAGVKLHNLFNALKWMFHPRSSNLWSQVIYGLNSIFWFSKTGGQASLSFFLSLLVKVSCCCLHDSHAVQVYSYHFPSTCPPVSIRYTITTKSRPSLPSLSCLDGWVTHPSIQSISHVLLNPFSRGLPPLRVH